MAELAGTPLQPWQRYVADVAGELIPNPDPTPLPWHPELVHAYDLITISVGRRAGKSVLSLARAARAAGRGQVGFYTAQNGKAAAEKFRNDWVPLVRRSPTLDAEFKPRLTNGTETLAHLPTAGYVRIFAPIATALHGDAADWIAFDEAWAHPRDRGADLEVAAHPLLATRPGAQLWVMSAAGDVDSTWWLDYLDAGRAATERDAGIGHAHFEWTGEGLDLDLDDPANWPLCHPSIRTPDNPTGMVGIDYLVAQHARDRGQFLRSWLNIGDRAGTGSAPIDFDTFAMLDTEPSVSPGLVTLGAACSPEQASSAIVACYVVAGVSVVEVVDHRPGYTWVVDRLVELDDRYEVHTIGVDVGGSSPSAVLDRQLDQSGLPVSRVEMRDLTAGPPDMVDAIRQGRLRHVPHPGLDAAVEAGRRRSVGDGAWTWGRRDADGDVCPLEAATWARWFHPDVHDLATPTIT